MPSISSQSTSVTFKSDILEIELLSEKMYQVRDTICSTFVELTLPRSRRGGFFFRYELNFDKVAVISDALATVLLSTLLLFVRSLFWLQRYMG